MNINTLLKFDAKLSNQLRIAEQPGLLRSLAMLIGHSGDSWYLLIALLIVMWIGNPLWKIRALILIITIIITAIVVLILKFSIKRKRPEGEWGSIYRKKDPHSFPSGHAARAMMMGVMAIYIGPLWFGWMLIIWAPLVGLARIAMGVHYLLDIIAGWVVGIILSLFYLQFTYLFF